jgi:hypothetical protein
MKSQILEYSGVFHCSGKVPIDNNCCFCWESKPGNYTKYIIFVCLYLESESQRPYFPV